MKPFESCCQLTIPTRVREVSLYKRMSLVGMIEEALLSTSFGLAFWVFWVSRLAKSTIPVYTSLKQFKVKYHLYAF